MSWKDEIVQRVIAAREAPAPAATIPAQPAPAFANAPAAAPATAADVSELWKHAIAKVSPPALAANALDHQPAPVAHAPAVSAPVVAATDTAAMWKRVVARASAPVVAQLKAMGLR